MKTNLLATLHRRPLVLAVSLLFLALAMVPAQAASLLDRFKKDVEEEARRLKRTLPSVELPSPKTETPKESKPTVATPTNGPTQASPAPSLPSGRAETASTSIPPSGQSLPPAVRSSSSAHNAGASPQAVAPEVLPGAASASVSPPKVTVIPLTGIQTIYETVQDDPAGRESFSVSRDGRHCASFKRLGLTSWTVQIDGQPGPELKGLAAGGFNGMGGKVFPTDDFSRVFYLGLNAQSETMLIIQSRDGTAKAFPVTGKDGVDAWLVDAAQSLNHVRLVRRRTFDLPKADTRYELQVDESGPVLGPFMDPAQVSFDSSRKHYLVSASIPVWIRSDYYARQPALFLDGVRVSQDHLPKPSYGGQGGIRSHGLIAEKGAYYVRLPMAGGGTKDVLSGTKVIEYPRDFVIPPVPVFSPDGIRLASVVASGRSMGIHLDGALTFSQPAGTIIENLQFTGDSQGLICSVGSPPRVSVFADGTEAFMITNGVLVRLWAGPRRGQYACLVKKGGAQELIVNGRRMAFGQRVNDRMLNNPVPDRIWFTGDGQQVFGYWKDSQGAISCFVDNHVSKTALSQEQFATARLLEPVRADDSRWLMAARIHQSGAVKTGATLFFRVEVEIPGRQVAKTD